MVGVQSFAYPPSLQVDKIQTLPLQTMMYLHSFAVAEMLLNGHKAILCRTKQTHTGLQSHGVTVRRGDETWFM